MQGVYMTISSALTLSGTPKDAGNYLISVKITDQQGREAVSNTLPFHVYTGEETLADRLVTDNFKQYESVCGCMGYHGNHGQSKTLEAMWMVKQKAFVFRKTWKHGRISCERNLRISGL